MLPISGGTLDYMILPGQSHTSHSWALSHTLPQCMCAFLSYGKQEGSTTGQRLEMGLEGLRHDVHVCGTCSQQQRRQSCEPPVMDDGRTSRLGKVS